MGIEMNRRSFVATTAATAALAATGATCANAEEAAKPAQGEVAETIDCDIVVCGLGAAGFMSAITAAKAGSKVVVLEKGEDITAPNGVYVSGPFAVGTTVLQEKEGGTTLTEDDVFYHVMNYTHWTPNPALMRRCIHESKNAVANLIEIGYEFKEVNFRFETPFIGEKGGFHLITTPLEDRFTVWSDAIANYGIDARFSTAMTSLVMDGDKVCGVLAEGPDGTVQVNAGAVIIATGGYLGNEDLQERFLHTRDLNVAKGGVSLCTGDGILACEAVGAALEKTFGYCPCEYGGTNDKASRPAKQDKYDQNYAFKFGYYGNLLVDAEGKRFLNEGMLCDFPMSYGSEQTLHNNPWYAIVDQTYVDVLTTEGLYNYMKARGAQDGEYGDPNTNWFIGAYFKDRILDKLPEDIEEGIAEGWCWKADTLEEVAEKFGLTNLVSTVESYNAMCEAGEDTEFYKPACFMKPVATAPFYAFEYVPSAWGTNGGIKVDSGLHAVDAQNNAIPGLYVAGVDAGSMYTVPYFTNPGSSVGNAMGSGWFVAEQIATDLA